jgi:hypothetical protein
MAALTTIPAPAEKKTEPKAQPTDGLKVETLDTSKSQARQVLMETLRILGPTSVKKSLGIRTDEAVKNEMQTKFLAADAFMLGFDSLLERNELNRVSGILSANTLYERAIEHANRIGVDRINEIEPGSVGKYLGRHAGPVKQMIQEIGEEKIKKILTQQVGPTRIPITKAGTKMYFYAEIMRKRVQSYAWATIAAGAAILGTASYVLSAKYQDASVFFDAAGAVLFGGAVRAIFKTREHLQQKKITQMLCEERFKEN